MKCTFDNIAGYKNEKEELKRLCEVYSNRDKYLNKGAKLPKGVIFYGEAGTGKTLFTKVLADECNLYTYKIDIGNLDSGKEVCKKIRKTFKKASKRKEPSMIFFDELDKLLPNDEEKYYTDQAKMILAQLLTLIDGMNSSKGIVFVATCNSYGYLPETLVRPGRIDKKINIGKPTFESRVEILHLYAKKSSCKFEITLEEIAKLCSGFTCSALETLINECIIQSDENYFISKELITKKVCEIKDEDIPRETSNMTDIINACRNIGYFVVAKSFNNGKYLLNMDQNNICNNFFNKILSKYDLDNEDYYDDDDYYDEDDDEDEDFEIEDNNLNDDNDSKYFCKTDLLNTISVLYGGYIAQNVVLNKTYDNLQKVFTNVNVLLLNMSKQGMFGIENAYSPWRNENFSYSLEFTNKLNGILQDTLSECYQVAEKIIKNNKDLIEKLIPILVKKKYMDNLVCEPILKELGGIKA